MLVREHRDLGPVAKPEPCEDLGDVSPYGRLAH